MRNHASFEENSLLKDLSYPIVCVPIHKLKIFVVCKFRRTNRKTNGRPKSADERRKIRNSVKTLVQRVLKTTRQCNTFFLGNFYEGTKVTLFSKT